MTTITDYQTISQTVSGSENDFVIAETGTLSVTQTSDSTLDAIVEDGEANSVTVYGMVWQNPGGYREASLALKSSGSDFTLTIAEGGLLAGNAGVLLDGQDAYVVNNGTISGDGRYGPGISTYSQNGVIENHGLITSRYTGIDIGIAQTVINDGTILSNYAALATAGTLHGSLTLINHRMIHGQYAIVAADDDDHIVNDGTLLGTLKLVGGDDVIDNRGGKIVGQILSGDGDDTLITDNAKVKLTETPDGGYDTVKSTVSYTLNANVEILKLIGKANIDGTATDTTAQREQLYGNSGNNTLKGLGGEDIIDGGAGNDLLVGGLGQDSFVYNKGYGVDTVQDFHHSEGDTAFVDYKGHMDISDLDMEQHKKDTWIVFGHGDTLILKNVHAADLVNADFGW
jgi:Ca2+-binding RTX toxin-like protein